MQRITAQTFTKVINPICDPRNERLFVASVERIEEEFCSDADSEQYWEAFYRASKAHTS